MTSDTASAPLRPGTVRCRTVATGDLRQLNYVRSLPPLPLEVRLGPADETPSTTPSETLLVALGSCLSAHIHADAVAGNITVHSLEVVTEADVAPSPMWTRGSGPPGSIGLEAIRVSVHMRADAPTQALQALIAHALLWSPVANTLHDPVRLEVALVDQAAVPT